MAIIDVNVKTDDWYWSLSPSKSFIAAWNPPDVNDSVAITFNNEYQELYKLTIPISLVDIILVKIGTVIIVTLSEKTDAMV